MYKKLIHITLVLFLGTRLFSQPLLINEFQAINNTIHADEFGEYDDWIEIYNNTTDSIDLNGYYITDFIDDTTKFMITSPNKELVIKPGGYIILWADGTPSQGSSHLNFRLSGTGEEIAIYSPSVQLVDSISFTNQITDVSYGRNKNEKDKWVLFSTPTPGSENSLIFFKGTSEPPLFNLTGGIYDTSVNVTLAVENDSGVIHYTIDNSTPDSNSDIYKSAFNLEKTTVIRAITSRENYLNSPVQSNLYIINESYSLPVMAIIIDSVDFWGKYGIYSNPWNEGKNWEKFCQVQYFIDGKNDLNVNAGIRIQGGNSVGMSKKSFRLFFKSEYGNKRLEYLFFGPNNISSFKNLIVKSGYDDDITTSTGTMLRDAFSAELWDVIGGLSTNSTWSMLYINDRFWGLYNLRESINEHFIMDRTGLTDFDLVRYGRSGPVLKYGSLDEWNKLVTVVDTMNFSSEYAFNTMSQIIDMDYFVNLVAFIQCTAYRSWTWGVSAYKEKQIPGKWRWTIWDTDRAYTILSWNGFNDAQDLTSVKWGNFLLKKLLLNDTFNQKLITRIADLLNTSFIPGNSTAIFDSLYNHIKVEMPAEIERWNKNNTYWESNVQRVRDFLNNRPDVLRTQIKDRYEISDIHELTLNVTGKGYIQVNTLDIEKFPWNGKYFDGIPVEMNAVPRPGYKFIGWDKISSTDREVQLKMASDTQLTAIFKLDSNIGLLHENIIINEICYYSNPLVYPDDWFELFNPNPFTVDISGWIFKDADNTHGFKFPSNTLLLGEDHLVVAKNTATFSWLFPEVKNVIGDFGEGANGFGLSTTSDMIRIFDTSYILIDSVKYISSYPWPQIISGEGGSIQLISPYGDNSVPDNWKFSQEVLYTPGVANKFSNPTGTYNISEVETSEDFLIYPNPFNENVIIKFHNPSRQFISIAIYNMNMKEVKTIYTGLLNEGEYKVEWTGRDNFSRNISPGIYICLIRMNEKVYSRKMIKFQ